MGNICQCSLGKSNTQQNSCPDLMQIASRIIIAPKFKADGTRQEFATTAAVTKAALQALFDAVDIDDRLFPVMELKNVVDIAADSSFQEFTDKSKVKIEDGKRNFEGFIINQGAKYLKKLESWACQLDGWGIYIIDKNENFVYITDIDTELKVRPILVDVNSFEAKLVKATDTTVEMIKISFDFHQSQHDKYLRYIAAEDLDFSGLDTADVYALYDTVGVGASVGIAHTSMSMTITTDYGLPVKGLLITDFYDTIGGTASKLWNVTTGLAVAIVSVTEYPDGIYTFTFAAQSAGNVMRCTPVKSHYDFAGVISEATTLT